MKTFFQYLESIADQIDSWRGFKSTIDKPFPSYRTEGAARIGDVLAVLGGSKPAAIIDSKFFNDHPDREEILNNAKELNLKIAQTEDNYIIGLSSNVDRIKYLLDIRHRLSRGQDGFITNKKFHIALGQALGMPNEVIKSFLIKTDLLKKRQPVGVVDLDF